MRCRVCGTMMDPVLVNAGLDQHPSCIGKHEKMMIERNEELKSQLLEIITWADRNSPRSQQLAIGPSEIGQECDQRVARTLAGMPQVNFRFDPWAGIVGTGIHSWMENAVKRYLASLDADTLRDSPLNLWITENRVAADDVISGSSDLFVAIDNLGGGDVVDYKSAASDKIKKMREGDTSLIPMQYRIQGHIYGLGNVRAGRKVRDIVLVFLPRNGLIKDMHLHREPYDEVIAFQALDRMYRLIDELNAAGLPEKPENWSRIPMTAGSGCWYCPFFVSRNAEQGPDATGCPGNSGTASELADKSLKEWEGLL